jgi:acetyl esterase/lipase
MTSSSATYSAQADQNAHTHDVTDFTTATLHMLSRWNFEIASLYGKRMQEYSVLPFSLMLCTSFDDFTDAQQKFSETLVADYRAAAERVANSVHAGKEQASEAYASALLKAQEDARNIIDQARAHAKRIIEDAEAEVAKPKTAEDKTKAA